MDPHTGRVLAMVGGFSSPPASSTAPCRRSASRAPRSSRLSTPPRSTTATRRRASSSTRRSRSIRARACRNGARRTTRTGSAAGPSTLRFGIEHSRNLMTVRLARTWACRSSPNMPSRFGVYDDLLPVLSMSLGAGETTLLRMATGYSMHRQRRQAGAADPDRPHPGPLRPDHLAARRARLRRLRGRRVDTARTSPSWSDDRKQIIDPHTAYPDDLDHGRRRPARHGARSSRCLKRPIAGKTGTTNDEKDAWFIGFTPDLVVGVFVGYDKPEPMGNGDTGGMLAAPIFARLHEGGAGRQPADPFRMPPGIKLVRVNLQDRPARRSRRQDRDHGGVQAGRGAGRIQ